MALRKVDLNDTQDTLKNSYLTPIFLADDTDGLVSTIQLASGTSEEFGGSIYVVDSGDLTVTDPGGLSDGDVYVYLQDTGTPTAVLSNTAPAYDPNLRGYYNGSDKAIWVMSKDGTTYKDRFRIFDHPRKSQLKEFGIENNYISITEDNSNSSVTDTDFMHKLYSHNNLQIVQDTATPTKMLDITYDYAGKIYIVGSAGSGGTGSGTATLELYINGVATGITDTAAISPGGATLTITTDYTISYGDNIQLYGYIVGYTTVAQVFNPSIDLYYKDIFGTHRKGAVVL